MGKIDSIDETDGESTNSEVHETEVRQDNPRGQLEDIKDEKIDLWEDVDQKKDVLKRKKIKYVSDENDYGASSSYKLTQHKKVKYEGAKYNCDQCEYGANQSQNLTQHKKSMHEGIKYVC